MTTQTTEIAPIVFEKDGNIFANSRDVAAYFGKRHTHVLRAISLLECSEHFTGLNFGLSAYLDPTGRSLPMYDMTKDGFAFLVMGFTGKEAARFKEGYIVAFNTMETELKARASLSDKEARSKIAMVREASKIHGKATAAALWRDLGLPMPDIQTQQQPAASAGHDGQDVDEIGLFINSWCNVTGDSEDREAPADLYAAYLKYAGIYILPTIPATTFYKRLSVATRKKWPGVDGRMRVFWRSRSNGSLYCGLRINPPATPAT